jgi:hypothetical protein
LLFCVTKLGRFDRSTGSVGFGKEKEDDTFAAKVGERDVLAVVPFYFEIRSFIAWFQHPSPRRIRLTGSIDRKSGGKTAELQKCYDSRRFKMSFTACGLA